MFINKLSVLLGCPSFIAKKCNTSTSMLELHSERALIYIVKLEKFGYGHEWVNNTNIYILQSR